ncbi:MULTISPECIES: PTS system mannose/fructose/N-acetylgalactosamine-transporter subunit IIB [Pediococcus]|jgi:PTS system mannose-specific IIB component|uniref:PTS mannose transporter subunit IIAB n=2 Tax=Pediococcus pentosaceus TaxID=1255 RepID=A0A0R2HJ73_PEDPE|nr:MULTISPECIES: PTS sugar transporter subunit IIB [Pediococcus]ABJ68780.1 Phosphotransferase system, mannose/fructose/N-acetylgalactosamine-specific component IIB [Pediococcus pentosaceus ATCC 25745]AHA05793.1 PTS mannose transporter subunit IID [Pediococcus pentosaceus SL4]ANI97228.1 PTS mannose transporter subunit IIAB [Pediococcus pentosaceus]ASC07713.1 Protein-N(pi)-phosphohistidine--sugar phosphotransferase [Pediococcus pentosaceus]AVL02190.1 PTS mannose transporter subunit IIAB [Pedioco
MTISAVRIDGRLIHGQVANLWTTKLGVTRIMVIDDKVAASDIEKSGLKLARPAGIDLSVLSEKVAADHIKRGGYDSQKVFIVVKRPQVLLDLVNDGVKLETINVGNMSQTDETTQITNSINVVQDDVDAFKALHEKGIKITQQMVPGDQANDFMAILKKFDTKK